MEDKAFALVIISLVGLIIIGVWVILMGLGYV